MWQWEDTSGGLECPTFLTLSVVCYTSSNSINHLSRADLCRGRDIEFCNTLIRFLHATEYVPKASPGADFKSACRDELPRTAGGSAGDYPDMVKRNGESMFNARGRALIFAINDGKNNLG